MPLLALGELEELVSDTQRGGGVEFARLALEHLRFLPVADDVGAVEGTVVLDQNGTLWIEDYGSLNGTYIITNGQETQVTKGTPLKLSAPATVRIGDQFFQFTEKQA